MTLFTNGHALVVGAGGDLPNTVDDAEGLAGILRDPERCGYPTGQVTVLTEKTAHRQAILDQLDVLASKATRDSSVIFYFSGHGAKVSTSIGDAYYFVPNGYNTANLKNTAVKDRELADRLGKIAAGKLLVLLDTCHAGGLDQTKDAGLQISKAALPEDAGALLAKGTGRVVIASCKEGELSFAGSPYSAFTLALIEALAGRGASKSDGFVRVADLALYTREMVPQRTKDRQHPILNFEAADNFAVAYYAGGGKQPKELPFVVGEIEPEPGAFRGISVAGDLVMGDKVMGDKVGGDKITVGNVSGTGIAIGRNSRASVNTRDPK